MARGADAEVELLHVPPRLIAASRFRAADPEQIPGRLGRAFAAVADAAAAAGRPATGPAVAIFRTGSDGVEVAAGFAVAGDPAAVHTGDVGPVEVPGGEIARATHRGPYESMPETYEAMREAAERRGLALDEGAAMWEEYHSPPDTAPEEITTVVSWPVRSA